MNLTTESSLINFNIEEFREIRMFENEVNGFKIWQVDLVLKDKTRYILKQGGFSECDEFYGFTKLRIVTQQSLNQNH